ncbi:MAG: SpoIIE family protein phosphatase [Candidatus Sumerlaeota bacterium]|nr:SpoIIE family protein phosphatase [Candidatus Sumerlaeota bacterium]
MAQLIIEIEADRKLVYELVKPRTLLGRSPICDLQIPDRRCSRQHAEIVRDGTAFLLHDLDSKNKVYVNEAVVSQDHPLKHGDRLRMGDTILIFDAGEGAIAPPRKDDSTQIQLVDDESSQWGQLESSVAAGETQPPIAHLEAARGAAVGDPMQRLAILYEVAEKIRSIFDLNSLLDEICVILQKVLTPDSLILMLVDEKDSRLLPRAVRGVAETISEIHISRSIVDQCMAQRVAILVSDASRDVRFSASESVVAHRIRSAICAPLIHRDKVLGVIYLDSRSSLFPYQREELELVTGIINQAATAIANARLHARVVQQERIEREMEIARAIQTNLLPRAAPDFPGFDIWGLSVPATKVGGDYFDYIPRGPKELALAIADVSGKGVPAALLTAVMRASLQIYASNLMAEVREIMSQMNRAICRDATDNMFVSCVFGILNSARRTFTYVNAGHCYPLLYLPDGRRIELDEGGLFLGLLDNTEYRVGQVAMPPGATLFLYTDGLTDMANEKTELFGASRLLDEVEQNLHRPAMDLCEYVFGAVREFRGGADQFDDCTLIAIKSL